MSEHEKTYYEIRLQREIAAIENQIKMLREEQIALKRQLIKARKESSALQDVSRKNSANRIMIEQRILTDLKGADKPQTTNKLYQSAMYVNFELKENTFRTYLHRMKQKGLIESPNRGRWRLPNKKPR